MENRIKKIANSLNTSEEIIGAIEAITGSEFSEDPEDLSIAHKFWEEAPSDEARHEIFEYLDKHFPDWKNSDPWWGIERFYRDRVRNYYLRNIPDALWTQVKHQAVDEKISLRELILKALYKYLED